MSQLSVAEEIEKLLSAGLLSMLRPKEYGTFMLHSLPCSFGVIFARLTCYSGLASTQKHGFSFGA